MAPNAIRTVRKALIAAVGRLDKSLSPKDTFVKLQRHRWTLSDVTWIFHFLLASFWIVVMKQPGYPTKLLIPILYATAMIIPFTSQFFVPATPIFAYLMAFFSSRFIPTEWRPEISVIFLPTLESALYGANISDILTRYTHPILDIMAWIPYGVGHFSIPFVVAAFLWLFRTKESLHFYAKAFGYLNLTGVLIQIIFPCAAPWYEVLHGLTPADYTMKGSPGGLVRIDRLFGGEGYTNTFSNAPIPFGAFPSLHAGTSTMEALMMSHFFPQTTKFVWSYVAVLYWATMYLTHHYLIDVVFGACMATVFFYAFLPPYLQGSAATAPPGTTLAIRSGQRNKYQVYDIEAPSRGARGMIAEAAADFELSDGSDNLSDEEMDITFHRSPMPGAGNVPNAPPKKSHRHTASIASLVGGDERSPVSNAFVFPPTPTRATHEDR